MSGEYSSIKALKGVAGRRSAPLRRGWASAVLCLALAAGFASPLKADEAIRLVCRSGGGMFGQLEPNGSISIKFRHGFLASLAAQLPAGQCSRVGARLQDREPSLLTFAGDAALRTQIMERVIGAKTFMVDVRDNGQGAFEIVGLAQ
ncbi:MAG: hypothetical protein U1E56_13370 [Bauldia sp.]